MMAKISEGVVVLVIGMLVVFAVLILLWAILLLFKTFFYGMPNKNEKETTSEKKEVVQTKIPEPVVEIKNETDDTELVAVITAAICALTNTSASQFQIKSIKRRNNWNK